MVYYWNDYCQYYMEFDAVKWWMVNTTSYYRRIQTQQERREWYRAYDLAKEYGFDQLIPRREPHSLDPWDIEARSIKADMKSWKALDRCRKQWGKKKYKEYLN